ncbi:MAG: site-specific integrase [Terracidiphilus sp.]
MVPTNSGAGRVKVGAPFSEIIKLYRAKYLPGLEHSTQQTNSYFLNSYIEPKFAKLKVVNVRALAVKEWLDDLKLAGSTKAGIRSVISVCLGIAGLYGYITKSQAGSMSLVKIKGVSIRQRRKKKITVEWFHRLIQALPEPLNIMVLVDGCFGLRISELVALKWEDIDTKLREIMIQRKFTHGKLGKTKSDASDANLPIADAPLKVLDEWRPKTDGSEWVFPSTRTGGVRSASMLLQKGIQPVARKIGVGTSLGVC